MANIHSRPRYRGLMIWLLITALSGAMFPAAPIAAQASPPLIVDDRATANPDLVDTDLAAPDGLEIEPQTLQLPEGVSISVLAVGLDSPRFMTFDPAGNLIVADSGADAIYRYTATDAGLLPALASPPETLVEGLDLPTSVAVQEVDGETYLYIGEQSQVSRYPYDANGSAGEGVTIVPNLPVGGHSTRTVIFGPDGWLYLSVGSSCNICDETEPLRATVSRYRPDGSGGEVVAEGLRNAVGLAFQPGTEMLWATVNERDNQGDEIPPDLVTVVEPGANYGWPDCLPPDATPQNPDFDCSGIAAPTVGIQAHSAPLGLAFYEGTDLPEEYAGDLFVIQHGSWNRSDPAQPKLLWIDLEDGQPVAARDFVTGWQDAGGERWGRPAGVVVAPDGSLIVSDDENGMLYRISAAT